MDMKSLLEINPNASQEAIRRNPHLLPKKAKKTNPGALWRFTKGEMNGTEAAFGLMLEAKVRNGEIHRYEFEGMSLRWADMRYTPDFVVFQNESEPGLADFPITLIEVKGPHIHYRQQAIARFKGCRAWWPEFQFELWQKQKTGWNRIL
jgi:hypothetical protein